MMPESAEDTVDALANDETKTEASLLDIAKHYAGTSVGFISSDLANAQVSALRAYLRDESYRAKEDQGLSETESRFVSGDVADAIDSILPRLLAAVEKQPRFIEFESVTIDDEDEAMHQSRVVEGVIRDKQLESHRIIHDFAKSGLLYRLGVMRIQWTTPQWQKFTMKNMTTMEVAQLAESADMNGDLEIDAEVIKESGNSLTDFPPDGVKYTVTGMELSQPQIKIQSLPPEAMLIPAYCETLNQQDNDGSPYVATREARSYESLVDMFPEKRKEIMQMRSGAFASGESGEVLPWDERRQERFADEQTTEGGGLDTHGNINHLPTFYDEYIRYDLNNDGHAELINLKRVEGLVLERTEVHDNPFAWWTPFPIPNKAFGESLVDKIMEFQDVNTELVRAGLNATALAVNPLIGIDASRMAAGNIEIADTLADLTGSGSGGIFRTVGPPGEVVQTFTPDANAAITAFQIRDMFKADREERVGLTPAGTGKDGASPINRTAAGMAMGQMASTSFVNYIADNFSEAIRIMAIKIRDMLIEDNKLPMSIKQGNEMVQVDPRTWATLDCKVNVAGAMINHQEKMTFLTMILEKAMAFIAEFGLDNPMVGLKQVQRMLMEMTAIMGFRNPDQFFRPVSDKQIAELVEKMAQQQDPEMVKVEAEIEMENKKFEASNKIDMMKMQATNEAKMIDMQMKQKERMLEMQMKAQDGQTKMQMEYFVKMQGIASEAQLAEMRMEIEAGLEARGQDFEFELGLIEAEYNKIVKEKESKISAVRPGGKVG